MKFYIIWETALKAIIKNCRRSFLTMLGIIIGIASIITIMTIGRGFPKETIDNLTMSESGEVSFDVFTVAGISYLLPGISTLIGLIFTVMPASVATKKDLINRNFLEEHGRLCSFFVVMLK